MCKPVYHILLNIAICHEFQSIYSSHKLWEVHGVKTRLYAGVRASPITWHSFSPELGGHVVLGIAMQHVDAFSEFTHRAENQPNAMQRVMLKHPAHIFWCFADRAPQYIYLGN